MISPYSAYLMEHHFLASELFQGLMRALGGYGRRKKWSGRFPIVSIPQQEPQVVSGSMVISALAGAPRSQHLYSLLVGNSPMRKYRAHSVRGYHVGRSFESQPPEGPSRVLQPNMMNPWDRTQHPLPNSSTVTRSCSSFASNW